MHVTPIGHSDVQIVDVEVPQTVLPDRLSEYRTRFGLIGEQLNRYALEPCRMAPIRFLEIRFLEKEAE